LKACNTVVSSRINCVAYVPSHKGRRTGSSLKHRHAEQKIKQDDERKQQVINDKRDSLLATKKSAGPLTGDSLLDIDSSDDEDTIHQQPHDDDDELFPFDGMTSNEQSILLETDLSTEQQDTREATMWLGTDDGLSVLILTLPPS
jgi:hypothetical protein